MRRQWLILVLGAVLAANLLAREGSVPAIHLKRTPQSVLITVGRRPFSEYQIGAQTPKPFLAPLRTLSGLIVTRQWPMETLEGESRDHQHHRGLWIGYGNISGVNFWENEFSYKPHNRGTITLASLDELREGKGTGYIGGTFVWRDPEAKAMLTERRAIAVTASSDRIAVDIDCQLRAERTVVFEDTKEGFFAIRVADSMRESAGGGMLENAEGARGEKAVWGKKSEWAVYSGTVNGKPVQIAIFDHPSNRGHPPRWHARAYGLFAVNPFGVKDFGPQSRDKGGLALTSGETLHFRYRVVIHEGELPPDRLREWYREYTQ